MITKKQQALEHLTFSCKQDAYIIWINLAQINQDKGIL